MPRLAPVISPVRIVGGRRGSKPNGGLETGVPGLEPELEKPVQQPAGGMVAGGSSAADRGASRPGLADP